MIKGEVLDVDRKNSRLEPIEAKVWEMKQCGLYGEEWQVGDPREIPTLLVEVQKDEVVVTYNLFPFLVNFLRMTEESEEMQKQFMEFCYQEGVESEHWCTCIDEFIKKLGDEGKLWEYEEENTYKYETILSGAIQYSIIRIVDGGEFIILQIHGGGDMRSGYSDPYIFDIGDTEYFKMAMVSLSCQCRKCNMSWYSDDAGYHWEYGGCYGEAELLAEEEYELYWKTDPNVNKVYHRNCGGEIEFFVMEGC